MCSLSDCILPLRIPRRVNGDGLRIVNRTIHAGRESALSVVHNRIEIICAVDSSVVRNIEINRKNLAVTAARNVVAVDSYICVAIRASVFVEKAESMK